MSHNFHCRLASRMLCPNHQLDHCFHYFREMRVHRLAHETKENYHATEDNLRYDRHLFSHVRQRYPRLLLNLLRPNVSSTTKKDLTWARLCQEWSSSGKYLIFHHSFRPVQFFSHCDRLHRDLDPQLNDQI